VLPPVAPGSAIHHGKIPDLESWDEEAKRNGLFLLGKDAAQGYDLGQISSVGDGFSFQGNLSQKDPKREIVDFGDIGFPGGYGQAIRDSFKFLSLDLPDSMAGGTGEDPEGWFHRKARATVGAAQGPKAQGEVVSWSKDRATPSKMSEKVPPPPLSSTSHKGKKIRERMRLRSLLRVTFSDVRAFSARSQAFFQSRATGITCPLLESSEGSKKRSVKT
jgi:hypothetical protein